MPALNELIGHWGYLAIFVVAVLGNCGLPAPEESILLLSGYLVWRGELKFPLVLMVAVVSACTGDNLGYWLGRRYGRLAMERYGPWVLVTPRRLLSMEHFVTQYGVVSVFIARFFPGLRAMAGPLAAIAGMRYLYFFIANLLGALVYVPVAVGLGYGLGLAGYVERIERVVGRIEHIVLIGIVAGALILLLYRIFQTRIRPMFQRKSAEAGHASGSEKPQ
jgi:membrane protein DedA with SNARE-associated domain